MQAKRNIMPEEVRNAKLLLSKGLTDAEVASIIGRSVTAVFRIRNGAYDFMLEDVPNDTPDDSRVCILLKSIDSRLYQQNEDMKKAIDQLVGLNSALVELQNEIKVCSSCMSAMLDALNDIKSQNSPLQAEPEAPANKYPGKDFANWGEVIEYAEEQVVVPANVTAQIFYLKNRKPDKWKDKPQENTTEAQNNDMQTLADLLQRPVPDRDIKDFET